MKFSFARFIAGLLLWVAPWVMAADGVTPRQILIGQNITLQGGKNDYGVAVLDGIAAYLQSVNQQGGVNGRQVVLRTLDDDNQSARAETNARDLVTRDKVFILFGSIEGGPSTAVMKAATELKVPFFGRWRVPPPCAGPTSRWSSRCGRSTARSSAHCSNTPRRPATSASPSSARTPKPASSTWRT